MIFSPDDLKRATEHAAKEARRKAIIETTLEMIKMDAFLRELPPGQRLVRIAQWLEMESGFETAFTRELREIGESYGRS